MESRCPGDGSNKAVHLRAIEQEVQKMESRDWTLLGLESLGVVSEGSAL
jgi:hypothetical protein